MGRGTAVGGVSKGKLCDLGNLLTAIHSYHKWVGINLEFKGEGRGWSTDHGEYAGEHQSSN